VAYVVASADSIVDAEALRRQMAASVPDWMVPAAIVIVPSLPRSPHGKLDRRALPVPELAQARAFRPPATDREAAVCRAVGDVLGRDEVGLDDNFVDLGGHSLLAMYLVNRIRTSLAADVPIRAVLQTATIGELCAQLMPVADPDGAALV
jgi:hypothetical protein